MPSLYDLQLNRQLYRDTSGEETDDEALTLSDLNNAIDSGAISETSSESLISGEISGNLLMISGFIRSKLFVAGSSGWTINADGTAQFTDITLTGGTIKYGKTSFTDSVHSGYYISADGIYFGSAGDTSRLKYVLASGAFDLSGSNLLIDATNNIIRLGSVSDNITLDATNKYIRSSNFVSGASGFNISSDLVEAENIRARGTLAGSTFAYDIINAVGGMLMIANADTLDADMTVDD